MIPAGKKLIDDIVTNGISMLLYGEAGRTKKNTKAIPRDVYFANTVATGITITHIN